jgi:hypothetical protein
MKQLLSVRFIDFINRLVASAILLLDLSKSLPMAKSKIEKQKSINYSNAEFVKTDNVGFHSSLIIVLMRLICFILSLN